MGFLLVKDGVSPGLAWVSCRDVNVLIFRKNDRFVMKTTTIKFVF